MLHGIRFHFIFLILIWKVTNSQAKIRFEIAQEPFSYFTLYITDRVKKAWN
jgi:hypothetical protein